MLVVYSGIRQQEWVFATLNRATVGHGDKYRCRARGANIAKVTTRKAGLQSASDLFKSRLCFRVFSNALAQVLIKQIYIFKISFSLKRNKFIQLIQFMSNDYGHLTRWVVTNKPRSLGLFFFWGVWKLLTTSVVRVSSAQFWFNLRLLFLSKWRHRLDVQICDKRRIFSFIASAVFNFHTKEINYSFQAKRERIKMRYDFAPILAECSLRLGISFIQKRLHSEKKKESICRFFFQINYYFVIFHTSF